MSEHHNDTTLLNYIITPMIHTLMTRVISYKLYMHSFKVRSLSVEL